MRRRIRLTGRRQLSPSSVDINFFENNGRQCISLVQAGNNSFAGIPKSARVKLRLSENKLSETLNFGTLRSPKTIAEVSKGVFSAPSCQLRVVATENDKGLILASTNEWTLRKGNDDEGASSSEGILLYQPADITPRCWKLDIRDDDYPIIYVDRSIPDARAWVRRDPIFRSCVLPAIVREIFEDIFAYESPPDQAWAKDWLEWANILMPDKGPPWDEHRDQKKWVERLLDNFCQKHDMLALLADAIEKEVST